MESPMDLWGGIPNSWIPFILVFMGLAVIGFLVFTWFFLFQWTPEAVDSVVWPWQKYENTHRYFFANFTMMAYSRQFSLENG